MKVGDVVCISSKRYDELPHNAIGEIYRINPGWLHPYVVRAKEHFNSRSQRGHYYFDIDEISKLDIPSAYPNTLLSNSIINIKFGEKENKIMKNKQLIKGYKKVAVKFHTAVNEYGIPTENLEKEKIATLYALYDATVNIGDFVLCATEHGSHTIGQVTKFFEDDAEVEVTHGREIICKIDYSNYVERQDRLKKVEKLKAAMQKKKEELNELAVYQALAATSPEMAEMLKELKELL